MQKTNEEVKKKKEKHKKSKEKHWNITTHTQYNHENIKEINEN